MAEINVRRWAGSLATSVDPEESVPGDFDVLRNFVYDPSGLPRVRGGRRIWGANPIAGDPLFGGLYHFRQGWLQARPRNFVIGYAGTKIFYSEFPMINAWTELFAGLEDQLVPSFATLRGWMVFSSNSERFLKPRYWNGTGGAELEELSDAPDAFLVASHAGRLWVVDQQEPSKIWFSELYSPHKWRIGSDGAGFLQINPGDGNVISALVPGFAGEMIIFKDGPGGGATYRLSGLVQSQFAVTPLSTTIGAISSGCATMVGDRDIFFASRRAIHSLRRVQEYGDLETANIDVEISERWRGLSDRAKSRALCVDDYVNDTWWLFVDDDSDGVNDAGILFNYRHATPRGNPKISEVDYGTNAAAVVRDEKAGRNSLLTGGSGRAFLENSPEAADELVPDEYTDITWEAKLKPIDANDSFGIKGFEELWLKFDHWGWSDMTIEWWCDNQVGSSETVSLNPDGVPAPYKGLYKANEFRLVPEIRRQMQMVHLRRGGISLTLRLTGLRGRTALRSMKILFEPGAPNLQYGQNFPYVSAWQKGS